MRRSFRLAGFIVISNNSWGFISPNPLSRLMGRPTADFFNSRRNLGYRKQRSHVRFRASFNHLEKWFILTSMVLNAEAVPGQLLQQLLNGARSEQFFMTHVAGRAALGRLHRRVAALGLARMPQVQVRFLRGKPCQLFAIPKVVDVFSVPSRTFTRWCGSSRVWGRPPTPHYSEVILPWFCPRRRRISRYTSPRRSWSGRAHLAPI